VEKNENKETKYIKKKIPFQIFIEIIEKFISENKKTIEDHLNILSFLSNSYNFKITHLLLLKFYLMCNRISHIIPVISNPTSSQNVNNNQSNSQKKPLSLKLQQKKKKEEMKMFKKLQIFQKEVTEQKVIMREMDLKKKINFFEKINLIDFFVFTKQEDFSKIYINIISSQKKEIFLNQQYIDKLLQNLGKFTLGKQKKIKKNLKKLKI
jgi:hypothetical protein